MTEENKLSPKESKPIGMDKMEDRAAPAPSAQTAASVESNTRRRLRLVFRWFLGIVIVFALGMVTAIIMIYQPAAGERAAAQAAVQEAEVQIVQQADAISALELRLAGADAEIERLEAELADTTSTSASQALHLELLSAIADVYAAQYALSRSDRASARLRVTSLPARFEALAALVDANQEPVLDDMLAGVLSVQDKITADDIQGAQDILDVISGNLLLIENSYFTGP